jgi:hypothetical protein
MSSVEGRRWLEGLGSRSASPGHGVVEGAASGPAGRLELLGRSDLRSATGRIRAHAARLAPVAIPFGVVLLLSALAAYWSLFSQFHYYDDTGFDTYSIRLFAQGHVLYNEVFTPYGPFVYELWGGLLAVLGRPLTTDSAFLSTWVVWVATSLLIGVTAKRLTGRLSLGIVAQVLSFAVLTVSVNEPVTPDLLVTSMQALLVVVCAFGLRRWPEHSLAAVGALVGALLLSKINSGAFALVAVSYAAIATLPRLRRVAILRWGSCAALVLAGPLLMSRDLSWSGRYALLGAAGGLALALAGWYTDPAADDELREDESSWWTANLLRGLGYSVVAILGVIFILGTSPGAMFETLIVDGARQRLEDPFPAVLAPGVVWWALAGVLGALLIRGPLARRGHRYAWLSLAGAAGRILAGFAIWSSLVGAWPFSIAPNAEFALALPLAWVAAIPCGRDDASTATRFLRLLVPALAIMNALFAYPVAGSQVGYGSVLFVLCGAVCVADGLYDLDMLLVDMRVSATVAFAVRASAAILTATLALLWTIAFVVAPMGEYRTTYREERALPFAGATRLHLEPKVVSVFTGLIADARTHCRTLISMPGMASLNLWSGLPAPDGLSGGVWWKALLPAQLTTALTDAEAAPGLCEIRNQTEIKAWDGNRPLPQIPLVHFLERDFAPLASFGFSGIGHYELLVRRPAEGGLAPGSAATSSTQ